MKTKTCEVCVYDPHLASESNPHIEISAHDSNWTLLDLQHSRSRGGGDYGAVIKVSGAYDLFVDDTSTTLAPTSISALNGNHSLRLDVVLYPLPKSGGGRGGFGRGPVISVSNMEQLESHIVKQVRVGRWNKLEAEGVRKLVASTARLMTISNAGRELQDISERWQDTLAHLGIDAGFLKRETWYGRQTGTGTDTGAVAGA
jgi:hypothetical protein